MGTFTRASPSTGNPSFFKVMIGDFSKDLRIPPAFVKHFDGVVPHKSKIMRSPPDGKVWCVHVQKIDQWFFFQKGWREFVEENFIESGDFLVFHYVGNSKFEVVIYGKHCCEKELLGNRDEPHLQGNRLQEKSTGDGQMKEKKSEVIVKSDSSSSDEMETDSNSSSSDADESNVKEEKTTASGVSSLGLGVRTPCLGRLPTNVKARALNAASKFVSNYPFFKVVMQSTYLHARSLRIPKKFSSIHLKGSSRKGKLWASNRFWPVTLLVYENCCVLAQGWGDFVKDNALRAGDVCVFELLESNEAVLKVSFFGYLA